MANTYTKLISHFVFSTRGRHPWLSDDLRADLFAYMGGIFRNQRCASLIVNGTEDHVHILAHVRPSIAVSDLLREVKASSSEYMHREKRLAGFAWQEGYSAISVRGDDFENERRYIERQAEHHKKERYEFELRRILTTNGIEYDEKYLLG